MWSVSFLGLRQSATLLGLLFVPLLGSAAWGDEPKLSISGYDPVAYFTDGKPVQGKAEFRILRGTNCAGALPAASIAICSPRIRSATRRNTTATARWARRTTRRRTRTRSIPRPGPSSTASSIWRTTAIGWRNGGNRPRSTSSGPTRAGRPSRICRTRSSSGRPAPPLRRTTKVALRDGGHWLVVGGQVARDEAGNVVGKGDMRAQIEQVGKNVDACLKAGGATVKDIIFTVNHVTAPAEFDKYADLLPRYFGPPSPKSTTVRAPQLSSPDFLVQVEAFAAIK